MFKIGIIGLVLVLMGICLYTVCYLIETGKEHKNRMDTMIDDWEKSKKRCPSDNPLKL